MPDIIKTRAFVLRKIDYGDTSKIATLFTEEAGKISAIVKGAKSNKSKLGGQVDLLNLLNLVVYDKASREVQLITQADIIEHYPKIKSDLELLKYSSAIIELVLNLIPINEPNEQLFKAMIKIFSLLENKSDQPIILFIRFFLYFIKVIGYEIQFENCAECGVELIKSSEYGFNYEFGFLCVNCKHDHLSNQNFSKELFNFLYCLNQRNCKVKFEQNSALSVVSFLESYLKYQVPEFSGLSSLKMF